MPRFPLRIPAIRVTQPLGNVYVASLPASLLLEVSFSDRLRISSPPANTQTYPLLGSQRPETTRRLKEIAGYIDTVEAAFPNSIILGANYDEQGLHQEDESLRWKIERGTNDYHFLVIPSAARLASIIDGQHRLHAFEFSAPERQQMELVTAIYLDLPSPFHAYLFATINFNQKKVDRSLAYELFGYDIENEPPEAWSPEKTAVFLCRKLNLDSDSPLRGKIIVAAVNDEILFESCPPDTNWAVSTATIVDGILRLISVRPKADKDSMHRIPLEEGRSRKVLEDDGTPFRGLYLSVNDLALYTAIKNFFRAVDQSLWARAAENSYITKTVGIQALFDILRLASSDFKRTQDISIDMFLRYLSPASSINFGHDFFQASGKGRTRIKNVLGLLANLISEDNLSPDDRPTYLDICHRIRG